MIRFLSGDEFRTLSESVEAGDKDCLEQLRQFANDGHTDSQWFLGGLYAKGVILNHSEEKASYWYNRALASLNPLTEQGVVKAQSNLARMYDKGEGIAQDYQQALAWYRKAAERGDAEAQSNLGRMYQNGEGVAQDYDQALAWYLKAAEQNDAEAQYNLGLIYANGRGVSEDYPQAVVWWVVAAVNGHDTAANMCSHAVKELTPAALAEAQALAERHVQQYQVLLHKKIFHRLGTIQH